MTFRSIQVGELPCGVAQAISLAVMPWISASAATATEFTIGARTRQDSLPLSKTTGTSLRKTQLLMAVTAFFALPARRDLVENGITRLDWTNGERNTTNWSTPTNG